MDRCPVEQDYRKYDEGKLFKLNFHFFHGPSAFVRTRFIISFGPDLAPPRANEAEGYPTPRNLPWPRSSIGPAKGAPCTALPPKRLPLDFLFSEDFILLS